MIAGKLSGMALMLLCILPVKSHSQNNNFPIRNFSVKDYGNQRSASNWCVVSGKNGAMYFGNANGVIVYDGNSWDFIPVKYGSYVRTMALADDGNIYTGCYGDFGVIKPDPKGKLRYYSLLSVLPPGEAVLQDVIKVSCTGKTVYFQSEDKIISYPIQGKAEIIKPETSFHTSFSVRNNFYFRERGKGIWNISGEKKSLLPGSGIFSDYGVFAMLPADSGHILVVTQELGLYVYNQHHTEKPFRKIKSPDETRLLNAKIYGGTTLSNGMFALNTLKAGVLITNGAGKIVAKLDKETGLRDHDVKAVSEDRFQNLWLGMNNGISMVAYRSPLSYYGSENGLEGSVHGLLRTGNRLYAGTSNGLFYAQEIYGSVLSFKPLTGSGSNQFWEITGQNGQIMAAGADGLFRLDGTSAEKVFGARVRTVRYYPGLKIWLTGGDDGLYVLEENFRLIRKISEYEADVIQMRVAEGTDDSLRLVVSSSQFGITTLHFDISLNCRVEYNGFPKGISNEFISLLEYDHKILLGTSGGIVPHRNQDVADIEPVRKLKNVTYLTTAHHKFWLIENNRIKWYDTQKKSFSGKAFLTVDKGQIYTLYADSTCLLAGAHEGLVFYRYEDSRKYEIPYQLEITAVENGNENIFPSHLTDINRISPIYDYKNNSLKFRFSGIFFSESGETEYSWMLEGFDRSWGNWTSTRQAGYTNLPEGTYTFRVKSRNVYGEFSAPAHFAFKIRAPWYRTYWAYGAYGVLFLFSVSGFTRIRTRKLQNDKRRLESVVAERTREVVSQRDEIARQKKQVDEQHREITDSINYAQHIQRCLFASKTMIQKNLQDCFILFQPRNVVSGDFYWVSATIEQKFVLVVADSTGHGVPGAIMSILNISALNDALEADRCTQPGEILNAARNRIIKSLSGEEHEKGEADGMDCAIIMFESGKKTFQYAGANRPVWVVRQINGTSSLTELKTDRMPVGRYLNDHVPFRSFEFGFETGDMIYMFSDGITDQFGGEHGKKFNYKRLAALLTEISVLPTNQQEQTLRKHFLSWKGETEQTDDVCLVGIRL